ncbi:UNVERIFIED_CONTAM: putative AC transposase [Sesamum radiatum]|uniref:AC transposase n=1 Tax=Sesamum radiatum TaxID=300843 RepID=A0AAW2K8X8_SESRA
MDMDWINVRNFVKFLKIFYNVTLKFSGSSYITSNAFFRELATLHVSLTTMMKGDYHMASMAIRMRDKFNKYWGNIDNMNWFLFVAILLDPRYKLKYVSFGLATIYESDPSFVKRMTEKIEDMLHLLYKQYAHSSLEHTSKDKDSIQDYIFMQLDGEDDPSELLESQFAKHLEEEQCAESKSKVTRYLLDGCEKSSKDFDVLKWWKSSSSKYPILSKIAKDVLAIPVSTIASESAFSTSGRVIDAFRSSLSPKMVEALICTQDWLRASPRIDFCAIMEDIEMFEEFEQGFGSARVRSFRLPSPGLGLGHEIRHGSHPGLDIYAYYLRPCYAELLDIGTSYPIRATTVATASPSITHLQVYRRDLYCVMTGDGSSFWNSPSSLHTLTAPDKAYDDHIRDTVTSRTNPRYSHPVHVTVVIPQV